MLKLSVDPIPQELQEADQGEEGHAEVDGEGAAERSQDGRQVLVHRHLLHHYRLAGAEVDVHASHALLHVGLPPLPGPDAVVAPIDAEDLSGILPASSALTITRRFWGLDFCIFDEVPI